MAEYKENVGSLKISEEVLASIAKYAATDVEGVDAVLEDDTSLKGVLRKNLTRPITIQFNDDTAFVTIQISVKHGVDISEAAVKVQESVKQAIQNMTGVTVAKVNVNICGITFDDQEAE